MVSTLDSANPPRLRLARTPNTCDDMHGRRHGRLAVSSDQVRLSQALITAGDTWLRNNLGPVIASPWFAANGIIIITWDEGSSNLGLPGGTAPDNGGRIATLVISSRPANHGQVYTGARRQFRNSARHRRSLRSWVARALGGL